LKKITSKFVVAQFIAPGDHYIPGKKKDLPGMKGIVRVYKRNYESSLMFREKASFLFTRFVSNGRAKICNFCSSIAHKSCFCQRKIADFSLAQFAPRVETGACFS
jgi:hypothetical protein